MPSFFRAGDLMGAMLFSIFASFFVTGFRVFLFITLLFVPGTVARFLVKKRPLDKSERKKFRLIFAIVYICYAVIFRLNEYSGFADFIKLAVATALCLAVWLTLNSLITKIPKSKD
ncbi:MAG: hypothetical protein IJU45_04195 [Clostridia bacterium]|nr:hypothetical protein [Clostridia bacterium]